MQRHVLTTMLITISLLVGTTVTLAQGDCTDYVDLSGSELPIEVSGSTADAGSDYAPFEPTSLEPECWYGHWSWGCGFGPDVTYKWTAPYDGGFSFYASSEFDLALLVYAFTCPSEPIYPDDFLCGSHEEPVSNVELFAGDEVLIVVDGVGIESGDFVLAVYEADDLGVPIGYIMEDYHLPGVQAAIVKEGQVCWTGSFGMADIESNIAMTDDKLIPLGSTSKPVTATALMRLYDDGYFGLDDPINDYLPFEVHHPVSPEVPITFRMVLSHVAGIADSGVAEGLIVCDQDSPVSLAQFVEGYFTPDGEYYDSYLNFTDSAPAESWNYNNLHSALAGYLVEAVSDMPFNDYCNEYVFTPLGMDASSFMLENLDPSSLAVGYNWFDGYEPWCQQHTPIYPAVLLRTSAAQLARFLAVYMAGGEYGGVRILEEATVDLILSPNYPDLTTVYGLSWQLLEFYGQPLYGHDGMWAGAGQSSMFFNPEENYGAVAISNRGASNGGARAVLRILLDRATTLVCDTATAVSNDDVPVPVAVLHCHPNPFNPQTTVTFTLNKTQRVEVAIYDLNGRRVDLLANRSYDAGNHTITWNGRDSHNHAMPSGTYVVRLETESGVEARKVMLLR